MAANDLMIYKNVALPPSAAAGQSLTICEPSLANNGKQIYYGGNAFAARSADNAGTWKHINPFTTFPTADGGFCCDQSFIYDPSRDLTIWLMQYNQNPVNRLRLAIKKGLGGGVFDHFYDLRPAAVNPAFAAEWFDYGSAALSNDFLYINTNSYNGLVWQRALTFRIPLDNLTAGGGLSYNFFFTTTNESLRCVQGARDTMYFASHHSLSQIRVFTWKESSSSVTFNDVAVTPWMRGPFSAPGPDGCDWLGRVKGDITGAYLAQGILGFLWTAGSQPGRPAPYVRVARIDAATMAVVGEPDIWNSTFAFAYPAACASDAGDVGITLFRGGGPLFPTHAVGIWNNAANRWQLADTRASTNGPIDTKWGDYVTCRRHSPDGLTFIAAGFTLQGGGTPFDIEPRYVHFGLEKHAPAVKRWANA